MTNPDSPRQTSRISSFIGGPTLYSKESVETSGQYEQLRLLQELLQRLKDEGVSVPTARELSSSKSRIRQILGR